MFKLLKDKSGCVKPEVYLGQDKPVAVYNTDNTEVSIEVTVRGKSGEFLMPSDETLQKIRAFFKHTNDITVSGIFRILNDGHDGMLFGYGDFFKMMHEATGRN